jgi:hypothetical protein
MNKLALGTASLLLATLTACGGGSMGSTNPPPLPVPVVNASVAVSNSTNGTFDVAMSTSFQPAEWDYQFFQNFPGATTPLNNLQPHHIRLQGVSQGIPQTSASSWDFSKLDAITQPVLGVGDHSPEFQVAFAPSFMYDSQGNLDVQQFAGYAQNLVRYYNIAGFTSGDGQFHISPSLQSQNPHPITWWGIYNEPNINNMSDPAVYTSLYNTVVPAMQQSDPTIKFAAVELSGGYNNWEQIYFSSFAKNVTAHVDVVADHFYSTCNQKDTDQQLFNTVPGFAQDVQTIYNWLSTNATLANVPVWITENNVNADFDKGGGISACNGTMFVTDRRGSSPFFAAWRPYVFSRIGKAGARALYHWDFDADVQYGELNYSTAQTQLSYWVDYWLGQMFAAGSGQKLLQFTNSDSSEIEILPLLNTDGSVVVMISNHAVASPTDNNGTGLTANVSVDVSALWSFSTASLLTIDTTTSPTTGPIASPILPHSPISVDLNGYSVAFLKLQ